MSGIEITIALDSVQLEAALDRAIAGGEDLRAPMFAITNAWKRLVDERFEREVDPWGVPWKKRRDNADPGRKVLHKRGDLQGQVIPDVGPDYGQIGVEATAGPAKYARIHNEGGEIQPRQKKALKFKVPGFGARLAAKVVMPKRQFIGLGPQEQDVAEDVLADFVRGLFGVSGLSTGGNPA